MDDVRTDLVEITSLVKGNVERELLLRNEYLAAENEILRSRIEGRLFLARDEKARPARLGREVGTHGLRGLSHIVTPETVMRWYREFIAGVTTNPDTQWMMQIARNVTMEDTGFLNGVRFLIHPKGRALRGDRDSKFCPAFDHIIESAGIDLVPLPPRSANLNAYAERFVLTVKSECLWRLFVFGEEGLWHAITEHVAHYHRERNHQSLGNKLLFPDKLSDSGDIECRERLGGLLKY